jgi:hypothetical protein
MSGRSGWLGDKAAGADNAKAGCGDPLFESRQTTVLIIGLC